MPTYENSLPLPLLSIENIKRVINGVPKTSSFLFIQILAYPTCLGNAPFAGIYFFMGDFIATQPQIRFQCYLYTFYSIDNNHKT